MMVDYVKYVIALGTSAETTIFNKMFLQGPKIALTSSEGFNDGNYTGGKSGAAVGKKAFGVVYCPWALSSEWFRTKQWEIMGLSSLDEYLVSIVFLLSTSSDNMPYRKTGLSSSVTQTTC